MLGIPVIFLLIGVAFLATLPFAYHRSLLLADEAAKDPLVTHVERRCFTGPRVHACIGAFSGSIESVGGSEGAPPDWRATLRGVRDAAPTALTIEPAGPLTAFWAALDEDAETGDAWLDRRFRVRGSPGMVRAVMQDTEVLRCLDRCFDVKLDLNGTLEAHVSQRASTWRDMRAALLVVAALGQALDALQAGPAPVPRELAALGAPSGLPIAV